MCKRLNYIGLCLAFAQASSALAAERRALVGQTEWVLQLERNDLLASRYRAEAIGVDGPHEMARPRIELLRGSVRGQPDSAVRLSIVDGKTQGLVHTAGSWYTLRASAGDTSAPLLLEPLAGTSAPIGSCGSDDLLLPPALLLPSAIDRSSSQRTLRELEVATEADYEFVTRYGGAAGANARILSVLNLVDGVYETDLGLRLRVTSQRAWETSSDPYSATSAVQLLYQLEDYGNSSLGGTARDVVHLFSGKNLDSNVIGVAYVGTACQLGYAYSLSQDLSYPAYDAITTAHEIGHNLSAVHDSGSLCPAPVYVMNPGLQSCIDHFSPVSQALIGNWIDANSSCLAPASTASIQLSAQPGQYVAGQRLRLEVSTGGSGTAADVYVLAVAPTGDFASLVGFNQFGPPGQVLPLARSLPITAGTGVLLDSVLPSNVLRGTYTFYAILSRPGTPPQSLLESSALLDMSQLSIEIR